MMEGVAVSGRKRLWLPFAGFLAFAALALFVLGGSGDPFDRTIFLKMAQWARSSGALMAFLTVMSAAAEPEFRVAGAVLLVVGLLLAKRRRIALFVFVAMAAGAGLCTLIKALTMRQRPDLLPRLESIDSYSFPSGHAWNGMIFYGAIAMVAAMLLPPRWRVPLATLGIVIALFTGLARIALGVHWPSDVLAGWIGGGSWLLLCAAMILSPRRALCR